MNGISFAHPWLLAALALVPVLAVGWFWLAARSREALARVSRNRPAGPRHVAALLMLGAMGLAIVAAAQPRWGERQSQVPRKGAELMIVLDVSRSMDAADVEPSRIEATKQMLNTLLARLGGDRVGMVIFSGDARLRFPLTTDLAAASQVVSSIETAPVIVEGGSSSASGLQLALNSFDPQSDANRVILLLTDGDDLGDDPATVAQQVSASGTELLVAGVGTAEGGPVPVYDVSTRTFVNKLDENGNPIITKLNEPFLRAIAAASGGRYLGTNLGAVPGAVSGRLTALERTRFAEESQPLPVERHYWFAGAALALVTLASVAQWLPRPSRRAVLGGLAVGASLLAGCATEAHNLNQDGRDALAAGDADRAISLFLEAQARDPDEPRIRLNLAAAYHAAGRFDEATIAARGLLVDTHPDVRARAQSSIGHHQFAAGNLQAALDAFREALLENPDDRDARHDYEVVLRLLNQDQQPPGQTPDPNATPPPSPSPGQGNGSPTPGPTTSGNDPNQTPAPNPSTPEDIERSLNDLDARIQELIDKAGENPDASEALQILQLIAERQRIASLRDGLAGGDDPRDY